MTFIPDHFQDEINFLCILWKLNFLEFKNLHWRTYSKIYNDLVLDWCKISQHHLLNTLREILEAFLKFNQCIVLCNQLILVHLFRGKFQNQWRWFPHKHMERHIKHLYFAFCSIHKTKSFEKIVISDEKWIYHKTPKQKIVTRFKTTVPISI